SDCEQDVCLADGSSYSYECDETKCNSIIIDTNGDKRPNSAGKDRYRMLVTDHGLIAQGESEYCGTIDGGLDCGKYILTYHKLFDGLINNCTAYDNGQCSSCENGYQNNGTSCKDIRENTCDTYSGTTCTKCTSDNLLVDNECVSKNSLHCQTSNGVSCTECDDGNYLKGGSCKTTPTFAKAVSENGTKVTLSDDTVADLVEINGVYAAIISSNDYNRTVEDNPFTKVLGAKEKCESNNMRLPTTDELVNISKNTGKSGWSSEYFPEESSTFSRTGAQMVNGITYSCDGTQGQLYAFSCGYNNQNICCSGGFHSANAICVPN
ncbi:hypothetical protein IJ732_02255, partial [bacterium]|nr:hypothetical protein [bacterium]